MRLFALPFAIVFAVSSPAFSGAKEHFINGREYYEEGSYVAATEEFEKAYALDPRPAFLYNIAQCFEKLGKLRQSIDYLNRFLEEDKDKTETQTIKNKIGILEERIRRTGVSVTATEAGATIYIDDEKVGTTPSEAVIPLPEGMHAVRITKSGFEPFIMNVGVSTGYSVPVYAKLTPLPEGQVAPVVPIPPETGDDDAPPASTDAAAPADAEVSPEPPAPAPSDTSEREALDFVPWAIAGTGAAIAIAGFAGIGSVAYVKNDETLAHAADGVGWPGVAIAAAGAIWGIVRIIKKKRETDSPTAMAVPIFDNRGAGIRATVAF